jgi:hypothetical protein
MSQEESGFTLHFGASDDEDWESVPLDKLTLVRSNGPYCRGSDS